MLGGFRTRPYEFLTFKMPCNVASVWLFIILYAI